MPFLDALTITLFNWFLQAVFFVGLLFIFCVLVLLAWACLATIVGMTKKD